MQILIKDQQLAGTHSPPDLILEPGDDPALLAGALGEARVIAVNFPKYADGRGYSIARLLRERYGYQGELRAIGVVARDHLQLMAQCGFDSFQLREGEDAKEALAAFDDISESYQASAALPAKARSRRGR